MSEAFLCKEAPLQLHKWQRKCTLHIAHLPCIFHINIQYIQIHANTLKYTSDKYPMTQVTGEMHITLVYTLHLRFLHLHRKARYYTQKQNTKKQTTTDKQYTTTYWLDCLITNSNCPTTSTTRLFLCRLFLSTLLDPRALKPNHLHQQSSWVPPH